MQTISHRKLSTNEKLIIRHFEETGSTLDAEALWLELKAAGHPISIGSTYKNVKRLAESGYLCRTQVSYRIYEYCLNMDI